ncbi:Uma2 family endonuclease [Cyanobacteria bacterium FACHB-63]|nr:Uma2 family endonuclease [Cyanobacteria bacterium FACHB-63]
MTQAKPRFQTIEEYAALEPSELPEGQYELVNGEIIELPPESDPNVEIAGFLSSVLLQFVPHYLIRRGTEIFVSSRTVTSRYPDLVILSEEGRAAIKGARRSTITPEMPPPRLVIEVVSPGEPGSDNYNRDYVDKPREYAARGIPEYWIVDPERSVVLVLTLQDDRYQTKEFGNGDRLVSPTFPNLQLTAAQILEAGA